MITINNKIVDIDLVEKARKEVFSDEKLYDLSDFFKVFGDSTRIKILNVLFSSEMCVGDIANVLGMSNSAISHQLRILKQTRLVKYEKRGKLIYYSLDDEHIKDIFFQGMEHINEL